MINAGPLLDVDGFINRGILSVAGGDAIGSTRLTGNLTQSDSGVLAIDVDPSDSRADQLNVGGRADIDGTVSVNLVDVWQPRLGVQSVPVLTADGGLTVSGAEVTRSAVGQYRLDQLSPNALELSYNIDFANAGILAGDQGQSGQHCPLHPPYLPRAGAGQLTSPGR